MSDLLTQEPAATTTDQPLDVATPSAQPTAEESGRQERATISRGMNAFLRNELDPAASLKPAEAESTEESAPTAGDVEAGDTRPRGPDGKFLPRRGAAEAVRTAEERVADLERQLAERDPDKLRQQWETERTTQAATETDEQQARAEAERYERLRDVPDRDLSDDDYRWREERKALLASFPKAQKALRADVERTLAAERNGILSTIAAEVRTGAHEFGVDPDTWGPNSEATWLSMTRDAVAAQTTPLRERIAELERELHSARTVGPNGLGSLRVPELAGRSDGSSRSNTMNDWLRNGR